MAPELATEALADLPAGSLVLDPMCGSGTAVLAAAKLGHKAVGIDIDPHAVLLTRVATSKLRGSSVERRGQAVLDWLDSAEGEQSSQSFPPWIEEDPDTRAFVDSWFLDAQARPLSGIASKLASEAGPVSDALRVALCRTIVTKERGASLARDTSHSRPHRVFWDNDYDVRSGFERAVRHVAAWLDSAGVQRRAQVQVGDARRLPKALEGKVDLVVTSPPYLNAIDYLRGHRLALVWMGHSIATLRKRRSDSVGAERKLSSPAPQVLAIARAGAPLGDLPSREKGMLYRYAADMQVVSRQLAKALRVGGGATMVVGNSTLRSVFIRNSECAIEAARLSGLRLVSESERELPASHRYLPPPDAGGSALAERMRTEAVLSFVREA